MQKTIQASQSNMAKISTNFNKESVSTYKDPVTTRDIIDSTFHLPLTQMRKFQIENDISVNVFTLHEERQNSSEYKSKTQEVIVPCRIIRLRRKRHVSLILSMKHGKAHYMYTDNLNQYIHDVAELRQWFDFSKFDFNHLLCDQTKNKEVGLLKYENECKHVKCVVGVRPKLYSLHVYMNGAKEFVLVTK